MLRFTSGPSLPMLTQSEAGECGLACLAMVATYHGHALDLTAARRRFALSINGTTLKSVLEMARKLGLAGRGLRLEPSALAGLRLPAILHWDMNHFVVLKQVRGRNVVIHDPARGIVRYDLAEVARHFTGIALELTPTQTFERKSEVTRMRVSQLLGRVGGMTGAIWHVLVLSLVLQVFVLASPFYMQLAVDEAVLRGDHGLLLALALGFALLTAIKLTADWLRARLLLMLGAVINFRLVVNLFHHLIRLPLDWFGKRHIGDIVSRFGATRPITELVTDGMAAAVVDGLMAAATLAMIFVYSAMLACVVLLALLILAALRLATFRLLRRKEEDAIGAAAREQTCFIETARAMQAIKLFGREADREALWQGKQADVSNFRTALGRTQMTLRVLNDLVLGAENILVVYLGARLAIGGEMTVGMLFAFMGYKQQFFQKATGLLEMAIRFRLMDLHLTRIADIAFTEAEAGLDTEPLVAHEIEGAITLRDVGFRYAETEAPILSGIDLTVRPGEFVALTGPSGCGKTTLLRLVLGLHEPDTGEILIDGRPLQRIGVASFRAQIGAVMQDDMLLTGSLAENISFFDPRPDVAWMRECAVIAGLDDEIMAMAMNYNTMVGDLGIGLSGGQRQRLLLARALYRRPRILFMDEGTSHLDAAKEREVNQALSALRITRVVIAHRSETIAAADRVVTLRDGRIVADTGAATLALAA